MPRTKRGECRRRPGVSGHRAGFIRGVSGCQRAGPVPARVVLAGWRSSAAAGRSAGRPPWPRPAAEEAAGRAARLAGARSTVARLSWPMEEAGFRTGLPVPRPGLGLRAQVRDRPDQLLALGLRRRARLCRPTAGRRWRTRAAELVQNCLPCRQRGSSRRAVNHSVTDLGGECGEVPLRELRIFCGCLGGRGRLISCLHTIQHPVPTPSGERTRAACRRPGRRRPWALRCLPAGGGPQPQAARGPCAGNGGRPPPPRSGAQGPGAPARFPGPRPRGVPTGPVHKRTIVRGHFPSVSFPQELGVRMPCPQLRKAAGGYRAVSMAVACQGKLPGQAAH